MVTNLTFGEWPSEFGDARAARPPHPPLRYRRNRQRKLALQEPRLIHPLRPLCQGLCRWVHRNPLRAAACPSSGTPRRAGPPYGLPAQAATKGVPCWTPIEGPYSMPIDNEHQAPGLDRALIGSPSFAVAAYVAAIRLARDKRLFLTTTPILRKKRLIQTARRASDAAGNSGKLVHPAREHNALIWADRRISGIGPLDGRRGSGWNEELEAVAKEARTLDASGPANAALRAAALLAVKLGSTTTTERLQRFFRRSWTSQARDRRCPQRQARGRRAPRAYRLRPHEGTTASRPTRCLRPDSRAERAFEGRSRRHLPRQLWPCHAALLHRGCRLLASAEL